MVRRFAAKTAPNRASRILGNSPRMSSQEVLVGSTDRPANHFLRHLNDRDFALIAPYLEHGEAVANQILYNAGDEIESVLFPCGPCLVSYVVAIEDGREIESILVGREGLVGSTDSDAYLPAYSGIVVKVGGPLVRLPVDELAAAKLQSASLREAFARYASCLLAQLLQSTACNAVHSIEQRAAKWINSAIERTGNAVVPFTHEQLASMLGVGRSYASRVIQTFKNENIVETRRGAIVVRNRAALHVRSCGCNTWVMNYFEEVLGGVCSKPDKSEGARG
jgi:CRP-like cAMP-binding protein